MSNVVGKIRMIIHIKETAAIVLEAPLWLLYKTWSWIIMETKTSNVDFIIFFITYDLYTCIIIYYSAV